MAKHYKVNEEKKTVSFVIGSLTDKEDLEVAQYQKYGYNIVLKQKSTRGGLTFADMRKAAIGKAFAGELEEKINAKENYMQIRKWFLAQTK